MRVCSAPPSPGSAGNPSSSGDVEEAGIVFPTVTTVLLNNCVLFPAQFLPLERRSVARHTCSELSKHGVLHRAGTHRGTPRCDSPAEQSSPHGHRAVLAFVGQRGGNGAGNLLSGAGNGAQQTRVGRRSGCSIVTVFPNTDFSVYF